MEDRSGKQRNIDQAMEDDADARGLYVEEYDVYSAVMSREEDEALEYGGDDYYDILADLD